MNRSRRTCPARRFARAPPCTRERPWIAMRSRCAWRGPRAASCRSIGRSTSMCIPSHRRSEWSPSARAPTCRTSATYIRQVRQYRPAIATDPERVLRLDPDLLLVSSTSRADFCALVRSADVPIYRVFTTFTTLAQVAETIRLTGYLTGEDDAAAEGGRALLAVRLRAPGQGVSPSRGRRAFSASAATPATARRRCSTTSCARSAASTSAPKAD